MKRFKNISVSTIGILLALIIAVCPRYYVYASGNTESQEVTSDDNNVQKVFDYWASMAGACVRGVGNITKIPENVRNRCYETIASLFNGGGIYVDSDGNYVFSNDASRQIYNALMADSTVDANVISDFNNFSFYADGYVNAQYLQYCNEITAWGRDVLDANNTGNYILYSCRFHYQDSANNYIRTALYCFRLTNDFSYVAIKPYNGSASSNGIYLINLNGDDYYAPYTFCVCTYNVGGGSYSSSRYSGRQLYLTHLHWGGEQNAGIPIDFLSANQLFLSFPYFENTDYNNYFPQYYDTNWNYYCNNSLIFSKDVPSGNALANQTSGIFADYVNLGTVNKTVIENNNWNNIYNNYVQNVNIDYQQDPSMTTSDFRKVMKKYSSAIIDAINQGNQNIEETVSISNRYLQAISVDVRNISDKLDSIIENGGGSSSGGGLSEEQYNTLIGLINNINDHAVDIASNTDGAYLELQDISDNTASTNTNLVAMKGVLDSINSKIRNKNDKPLPDPDFWDNLTDDLIDITDTVPEKFANAMTVIATAFKTVVPFGYIAVVGVLITSLAEDPEPPVFEIDLQNDNSTIPLNWQGTIDLTWVDSIMPIMRALECIVFIIGLIMFTFTVFNTLGSLFS